MPQAALMVHMHHVPTHAPPSPLALCTEYNIAKETQSSRIPGLTSHPGLSVTPLIHSTPSREQTAGCLESHVHSFAAGIHAQLSYQVREINPAKERSKPHIST